MEDNASNDIGWIVGAVGAWGTGWQDRDDNKAIE